MKTRELHFEVAPVLVLCSPAVLPRKWSSALHVIFFVLFGSAASQATAQNVPPAKSAAAPQSLPSVGQILDRYVSALGGRSAIEKFNSRVMKGWIEYPEHNLTGEVEIAAKAPDKLRVTFIFAEFSAEQGYDGAVAWEALSRDVIRTLRGERAANSKIDSQFYSDLRIAELFPQLRVIGTEVVDGQAVYVVEGVPAEGSHRWFYFNARTGLLDRYEFEVLEPPRAGRYTIRVKGYKDFDGVKLPVTMYQEGGGERVNLQITEVRHNVPLDDARFKRPRM